MTGFYFKMKPNTLMSFILAKGPVKPIQGVKIAHSFLQPVSNQFHFIILSLPMYFYIWLSREWLFDVLACVVRRWRGSWVNGHGWMEVGPRSYLHRWNALGS